MDINKIDLQSENRRLVETLADTDLVGAQIPETGELVAIEKSKLVAGGGGGGGDSLDAIYEVKIGEFGRYFDRAYGAEYNFTYEELDNSVTAVRTIPSNDRSYPVPLKYSNDELNYVDVSVLISNNAEFTVKVALSYSFEGVLLIFKKPQI